MASSAEQLAKKGYEDPVWFCQTFLGHLFEEEIPWVHRGLLAILTGRCGFLPKYGELDKIVRNFVYEDSTGKRRQIFQHTDDGGIRLFRRKYTEIMLPRGFSKTTIAGIAMPIYDTVYQEIPFGVYVSETAPHAKMQLGNVQRELTDNQLIREVFGNLRPERKADEKWTEGFFEATNGIAWIARGRGGQIRGLNHKGQRPTKIIFDDIEDKESVSTEEQREKARSWFFADLMPALPRIGSGTIVGLGTMLGAECLLETVASDPRWTVVRMGARDVDGSPLWPSAMSDKELELEKRAYARTGQLHIFYMEYFNEARAAETQKFKQHWFRYAEPSDIVATAIYCDPAIGKKRTADDTVVIVGGRRKDGAILVLDGWGKRGAGVHETTTKYFELHKQYACRYAGVETVAYQAALAQTMREEMFRQNHFFEIDEVNPISRKNAYPSGQAKKSERILGVLQPRFANGAIIFCRKFEKLEQQLLDYQPDSDRHDDWPDALVGVVQGLDPLAGFAAGEDPTKDTLEDLDDVMQGDWRWA